MSMALSTAILDLIQTNVLRKDVQVALRPVQMFRALVATRETWDARVGETAIFTRNGLPVIKTKPRTPGVDPTPQAKAGLEQWSVTCNPYNDAIDTNLPDSYIMIQNEVLRDARTIMLQAGITLNHVVRNKIYNVYMGGNTQTASNSSGTALAVLTVAGFKETLGTDGRMAPVSPANPIAITVAGVARSVTAFTATDPLQPDGAGVLTLSVAITTVAGDAVLSNKRPIIYRVGAGTTTDAIVAGNKITFADFRNVVASLRTANIPTFTDGTYHAQIDPTTEAQLFLDPEFQKLLTGVDDSVEWREFAIGKAAGITFFRNNEVPSSYNTSYDDFVVGAYTNTGAVGIHRPIVYGMGVLMEKYVPLDKMYAEKQAGTPQGSSVVTDFNVSQDQSTADLTFDGIKYILRAPQDRLQENVSQAWSFKGDWAAPCDSLTGTAAIYKRACIIEHAG